MISNINPQKEFERLVPIAIANACFSVKFSKDNYLDKFSEMEEDMRQYGQHYFIDGGQLNERVMNGIGAQLALEQHLGIRFTKWGQKKPDNIPDMLPVGLKVGVKCSKAPDNAPLISKKAHYPEIIFLIDEHDRSLYHCLGIFSPVDLTHPDFVCDSLKKDPSILEYKTGFYRIDKGVPFTTFNNLKTILNDKWKI